MDFAYDQIQGETVAVDRASTATPKPTQSTTTEGPASTSESRQNLNTEFQETFRAFSNSPWGAKLGGIWGNVRKQGESYYAEARKEVEEASGDAIKGFSDLKASLVNHTKTLSLAEPEDDKEGAAASSTEDSTAKSQGEADRKTDDLISRFKSEASKRLKEIEKAEDAADEALLRFGTNIRNFLREAVSVAPPTDDAAKQAGSVMFESKDASGKRVIHTTRFDAQLHVIHSSLDSYMRDPISGEWAKFKSDFNVKDKTDDISKDLEQYPELRRAMELLVPEKVEYPDFWCRYYFLRLVIETEERKRKELLQGASTGNLDQEEMTWGEDSDEEDTPSTPQAKKSNGSSTTIHQIPPESQSLKPEPRKSDDLSSRPDSDASYDLVSGATSRAPGSPKEEKPVNKKEDESEEEDWE